VKTTSLRRSNLTSTDFIAFYLGGLDCGLFCARVQLAWFEEDLRLAALNRVNVPWIVAMSHFPIFCTGCAGNTADTSAYVSVW